MRTSRLQGRPWLSLVLVCTGLALVSLASNWVSVSELEGQLQVFSFLRKTVSKLVNCGTVWAGIGVFAGWLMSRPTISVVAAVLAAEGTLAFHYGLGQLVGMYNVGIWAENTHWFILGVLACAPLGLVGWVARRPGWPGLVAGLVVPVGAVAEPWVRTWLLQPSFLPWPERWAGVACGLVLTVAGLAGAWLVTRKKILAGRAGKAHPQAPR
ncbi:MAG: hypothetical protein E6Z28_05475 [Actinomyces urogenitalis]|uniref:hypothetical protein n=1 Tax=Actinomyces urogenitalis TaxID=103621 RepID=UPI00050DF9F3|nr:hypothetical protein [Actinomyces urogenitalis]KGF00099.1 hypothetical protein HMPREF1626_09030 [Actinomyces urogenitalis S6-C4]MDU5874467.1 hypothetical protein [Actinomyces urogenitalis]